MQFLRQELIPLIHRDYRANPSDRSLLGHSMGANFALYTLFTTPDLFQRCVAASFDPVLDQEQAFAEINDSLPIPPAPRVGRNQPTGPRRAKVTRRPARPPDTTTAYT